MSENQWELVGKYHSGEASAEERQKVEALQAEDEAFRKYVEEAAIIWKQSGKVSEAANVDVDAAWNRVSALIDNDRQVTPERKPMGRTATMSTGFSRVAAALVAIAVFAGVTFFLFNNLSGSQVALESEAGTVREVTLPDGSLVSLNENSTLTYDKTFGEKNRTVTLKGEGFFEVERDESKPFIVRTDAFEVTVLGTSFDVSAYENNEAASVVVATGLVQVDAGKEQIQLTPGDMGRIVKAEKMLSKTRADIVETMSWRVKSFTFNNDKLGEVVENLSKTYHMNVRLSQNELKNCRLSATFNNRTLKEVLQIISSTLNVEVEKTSDGYLLTGEGC